jgi:hypothetical protein
VICRVNAAVSDWGAQAAQGASVSLYFLAASRESFELVLRSSEVESGESERDCLRPASPDVVVFNG